MAGIQGLQTLPFVFSWFSVMESIYLIDSQKGFSDKNFSVRMFEIVFYFPQEMASRELKKNVARTSYFSSSSSDPDSGYEVGSRYYDYGYYQVKNPALEGSFLLHHFGMLWQWIYSVLFDYYKKGFFLCISTLLTCVIMYSYIVSVEL